MEDESFKVFLQLFLEEEKNFKIDIEIQEKIFQNIQKQLNYNINAIPSQLKSK